MRIVVWLFLITNAVSTSSQAREYCGYLNKLIVVEKDWEDIRLALYNKEWPEKYIVFKFTPAVKEVAKILVAKTKDYSKNRGARYDNYFEWYYITSQSQVELCLYGGIYKKRMYKQRAYYYVSGFTELLSIKIDGVDYEVEELLKELKMNSTENQLICREYNSLPNLLKANEFKTCFYDEKLCYTGSNVIVANAIVTQELIATGDEHEMVSVVVDSGVINLRVFDRFAFKDQEAKEEHKKDFIDSYVVKHCSLYSQ